MRRSCIYLLGILILNLALAACSSADAKNLPATFTSTVPDEAGCATPNAASQPGDSGRCRVATTITAASIHTPLVPTLTVQAAVTSGAAAPTPLSLLSLVPVTPTPCAPEICEYTAPFLLGRPFDAAANSKPDDTYRFGSTQDQEREPHHGVDIPNPQGTPVLAAADGVVVVAGSEDGFAYGPSTPFYGNLVVIRHDPAPASLLELPAFNLPLFTLYGHLSTVAVQTGERVQQGQEIGKVGMTGVAMGSHLHFEVRLGENTYKNSRNPELWMTPGKDNDGQRKGAIAGRILDPYGQPIEVDQVVIQHLPSPEARFDYQIIAGVYEEKELIGLSPYAESFGAGGLSPGWYRVSFAADGVKERVIQVRPGQLSLLTFIVGVN